MIYGKVTRKTQNNNTTDLSSLDNELTIFFICIGNKIYPTQVHSLKFADPSGPPHTEFFILCRKPTRGGFMDT
jgi:hypothetical protein